MEISDHIRLAGITPVIADSKVDEETKRVLLEIVSRFDLKFQDLVMQMKNQPTIFRISPDQIEGAKEGDVAIFTNAQGAVDIQLFGG